MYSREESTKIRKQFWTTFGQYLSHHKSSEGLKVNWINYRTGLKDVYFKMDVVKKEASISIELHHPDEGIRELFFEQFLELKTYLHSILEEEWIWQDHYIDPSNGKEIARIHFSKKNLNLFNQDHWPELFQFLKPRIIKLDEFWSDAKYSFDGLR